MGGLSFGVGVGVGVGVSVCIITIGTLWKINFMVMM